MTGKTYQIELDGELIGTTKLEKADAPMGVVFGLMQLDNIDSPFDYFKRYCKKNKIVINELDKKYGFIDTQVIPNLKVLRTDGFEIKGVAGNAIAGMTEEGYEITIHGIEYPFFEEEFPHYVKDYNEQFDK